MGDVEELVDQGPVLILRGEPVEPLRDDLDHVRGLEAHRLPDPTPAVDPCDGPLRLGAPAPDAVDVVQVDVLEYVELHDLLYPITHVGGREVVDHFHHFKRLSRACAHISCLYPPFLFFLFLTEDNLE